MDFRKHFNKEIKKTDISNIFLGKTKPLNKFVYTLCELKDNNKCKKDDLCNICNLHKSSCLICKEKTKQIKNTNQKNKIDKLTDKQLLEIMSYKKQLKTTQDVSNILKINILL